MKKEFILSLSSLIFMVLFTTGTTFLYFKKKDNFNIEFNTNESGIQMGFDNYSSFLSVTSTDIEGLNAKEETSIKLYVRYKNVNEPKKLVISFESDATFKEEFQDKIVRYEILDKNNNNLVELQDFNYLENHKIYEEELNKINEDYIYTIKIIINKSNDENFNNIGQKLMSKISAQIN